MKLIIVDDNKTFRDGMHFYLEKILSYNVIAEASDGKEFLSLKQKNQADLVLMDIAMPKLGGIEIVKKTLWHNSKLIFVATTSFSDKVYLVDLVKAGFRACVLKENIYDELQNAIDAVVKHKLYFPNGVQM